MTEVIEFNEPCAWKNIKKGEKDNDDAGLRTPKIETLESLKKTVRELGVSAKSRKERLQLEEKRLVSLGCAPRKKMKVPLPILKGMNFKKRKREQQQKVAEREADIVTASSIKRRRKKH